MRRHLSSGAGRVLRHPAVRRGARWTAAVLAIALAVRTGGLGWDEIVAATDHVLRVDALAIGAILLLEIAWAVTLAGTQRSAVLAVGGAYRWPQALRISMAGFTLSRVVPGGGAAGGVFAMRELIRLGHPAAASVTAMVASWSTSITSLAVMVLGGLLLVVATDGDLPAATVVPAAGALAALAAVGGVVLRAVFDERLRRRLVTLGAYVLRRLPFGPDPATLTRSFDAAGGHPHRGRHLRRSFAWAAAAWACDAAALWLAFAACGYRLSPTALLIGYGSANLLNSVPELTPGWLGVFETALSATYISLGVPAPVAVAAVLVYRLASFWLPVAAGIGPTVRSLGAARRSPAPAVSSATAVRTTPVEVAA